MASKIDNYDASKHFSRQKIWRGELKFNLFYQNFNHNLEKALTQVHTDSFRLSSVSRSPWLKIVYCFDTQLLSGRNKANYGRKRGWMGAEEVRLKAYSRAEEGICRKRSPNHSSPLIKAHIQCVKSGQNNLRVFAS